MNLKEMSLAEFKEFASTHFIGNFHESINYALIKAEDYHFEYLSHSNGQPENEDDPFLYAEKHMPTYVGLDCTVNSSEPHKVFQTRAMIRELLLEENKRISEALGIERSIDL